MTNETMEQRLAAALEKTAPDDVSGVLSRCEARKGTGISMTTKKTAKRTWTSLIAACFAVMLLSGGLFCQQANAVASVVSLDVNPSIELKVSKREKVLACTPQGRKAGCGGQCHRREPGAKRLSGQYFLCHHDLGGG